MTLLTKENIEEVGTPTKIENFLMWLFNKISFVTGVFTFCAC